MEGVSWPMVAAAVAVVVLLILLALVAARSLVASTAKREEVLLLGLSGSGKTTLFGQLCYGRALETYTSLGETTSTLGAGGEKACSVVDTPGHHQLRNGVVDKHAAAAGAVVFVVDGVRFRSQLRDVAQYLYEVLTNPALGGSPVLVVANKQDIFTASKAKRMTVDLEAEINTLRETQSGQLAGTDDSESATFLGREGESFKFEHVDQRVDFLDASGVGKPGGAVDLQPVADWIADVMRLKPHAS